MTDTLLEAVLRRDRVVVATSLAAITLFSWAYLVWLAGSMDMDMGGMDMPGMTGGGNMSEMAMPDMKMDNGIAMGPDVHRWSAAEFLFMFVMWAVMMVGMMVPSAAPMILLYARVGRQAAMQGKPLTATGFFAGGYLLAWTVFSLFATIGQWALEQTLLITPAMASASGALSGVILIAAGLYQWTPQKDACLAHCQAPLLFIQRHGGFRQGVFGSLQLGFRHGLYCVGCCWALMALLFVGGVMNMLWIAAIAIFVLAEKLLPSGRFLPRAAGAALVAGGLWVLATSTL